MRIIVIYIGISYLRSKNLKFHIIILHKPNYADTMWYFSLPGSLIRPLRCCLPTIKTRKKNMLWYTVYSPPAQNIPSYN